MKRRDFLKTSAVIGSAAGATGAILSCNNDTPKLKEIKYFNKSLSVELLSEAENENLKVKVMTNASVEIFDKINNKQWRIGEVAQQEYGSIDEGFVWMRQERMMCQQYPARFQGEMEGENIRFTVIGQQNRVMGSFLCKITLDGPWLKYRILAIDEELESLVFPPPVECDELVIPNNIGRIIRDKERRGIYSRYVNVFGAHHNMRFVGGQKDGHAWICIVDEGFEDMATMRANRTISPVFMKTLDKWSHPFSFQYGFMKGNYVNIAKTYRNWFKEKGLFKSLEEKVAEFPRLKQMIGGRNFWFTLAMGKYREDDAEEFYLDDEKYSRGDNPDADVYIRYTYAEAKKLIKKWKSWGMKKGYIKIAGWINKGYDWSHPDVWPPEPKLGEVSELKEIMEMGEGIVMGLHDNYADMYEGLPSFPNGICRTKDGELLTGGFWAGGQAYIMHYKDSIEYGRRNWEKIKKLNPEAFFPDTVTALQFYQSYQKGKKRTKAEDLQYKIEFAKFYKDQGQIWGSEETSDFSILYSDFCETRHSRVEGEAIPLWPLVFHDAAIVMRYGSSDVGGDYPKWLEDMLYGYAMHFYGSDKLEEEVFKSSFHVDEWHEKIGMDEMTDHRFLTDDYKLEKTTFSSGKSIIVNFGDTDRMVEGKMVKAKDYLILHG